MSSIRMDYNFLVSFLLTKTDEHTFKFKSSVLDLIKWTSRVQDVVLLVVNIMIIFFQHQCLFFGILHLLSRLTIIILCLNKKISSKTEIWEHHRKYQ